MSHSSTPHKLYCNNLTCRLGLSDVPVWVTLCGHVFCDRCGTESSTSRTCISCRDTLGQLSIVRKKSLNCNPEWKMLILAGLPPETVMEICASAIQFYQNQTSNELHLMEEKLKRIKSRVESVKEYYEGVIEQCKVDLNTLEDKLQCQAKSSSSCPQ